MNRETLDSIPPLIDAKGAAKLLGVSYNFIINHCVNDEHGALRVGNKHIFDRDKLLESIGVKVS